RVTTYHEVDQRALEPCSGAAEDREARARDARAALEIDDPQRRPEIPVRLRREVEFAWHTVPPHLDVLGGRPADRHRRMRKVRQVPQSDVALPLDGIELESELLDLRRPQFARFLNRCRVLALALGACDFVRSEE